MIVNGEKKEVMPITYATNINKDTGAFHLTFSGLPNRNAEAPPIQGRNNKTVLKKRADFFARKEQREDRICRPKIGGGRIPSGMDEDHRSALEIAGFACNRQDFI